jgi:3-oxoacyl-[acyl-carrier protein] reductase
MDLGLKDRVAIVAASSSGLGKAVALALAREGARIAMCSRHRETIEAAAREVAAQGVEVLAEPVDVTREDQVHALVARTRERFGRIDICVTNAGGPPAKTFEQTTIQDWRSALDLNLMSTLYFAHTVLPLMKERRWGRFVTITSVAVKQPIDGLILSNSVRSGVLGLVKSLANEYGPYNVLVNNVCPGYTLTARLREMRKKVADEEGVTPEEIEQRWAKQVPLRRVGSPSEFADVVTFLASERAAYITGSSIAVDGGLVRGLL